MDWSSIRSSQDFLKIVEHLWNKNEVSIFMSQDFIEVTGKHKNKEVNGQRLIYN